MTMLLNRSWVALSLLVASALILSPLAAVHAEEAEATSDISFTGQLIELSATEAPTTIVVRENPTGEWTDYTVDITTETAFGTWVGNTTEMESWITGDQIKIEGTLNENTEIVTADLAINLSMNPFRYNSLNGWVTEIDETAGTMTVQWMNVEHVVNVTDNTHMVVPPTNPATLGDFAIGDRVRLRLIKDSEVENEARIIIALRRGAEIFLKARTRGFTVELNDIDDNGDGTGSLEVTLLENPHLRPGDVNNLVGEEGDELVITYDAYTRFVRKYMGLASIDELIVGDQLLIVGRVNDDDTISARLIKDNDLWRLGVAQHEGTVLAISTDENTITIEPDYDDRDEVIAYYNDETVFMEDGVEVTEDDVNVGDEIHVRGTAHDIGDVVEVLDVVRVWIGDDSPEADDADEAEDESEDEAEDESEDESEDEEEV